MSAIRGSAGRLFTLTACLVIVGLAACLDTADPLSSEIEDCVRPSMDTTTWTRTAGGVQIQLPPEFEQTAANHWERGGTRIRLQVVSSGDQAEIPFPEMTYLGSCRGTDDRGRRFVIDYGAISSGGPSPDLAIIASWRSVPIIGGSADIILSAQLIDQSDAAVVETTAHSIRVQSGPGSI